MALPMVLPTSAAWIAAAERARAQTGVAPIEVAHPGDAGRAQRDLRRDYGRLSRWALGFVGTLLAGAAALGVALAIELTVGPGARDAAYLLGMAAVITLTAASGWGGITLLVLLHRSGRRLARALAFWTALPYRRGDRPRTREGWFDARVVNFEPDILLRIMSASFAGLGAIFAGAMVYYCTVIDPFPSLAVTGALWTVLLAGVAVCAMGGVMRVVSGFGEADPLWVRLRNRLAD